MYFELRVDVSDLIEGCAVRTLNKRLPVLFGAHGAPYAGSLN